LEDELSLIKDGPARVKLNCRNPDKLRGFVRIFFNRIGYAIHFESKKNKGKTDIYPPSPPGGWRGEDGEEEGDESEEDTNGKHKWKHGSSQDKGLDVLKIGQGQKGAQEQFDGTGMASNENSNNVMESAQKRGASEPMMVDIVEVADQEFLDGNIHGASSYMSDHVGDPPREDQRELPSHNSGGLRLWTRCFLSMIHHPPIGRRHLRGIQIHHLLGKRSPAWKNYPMMIIRRPTSFRREMLKVGSGFRKLSQGEKKEVKKVKRFY
jgi:hypothetical protein